MADRISVVQVGVVGPTGAGLGTHTDESTTLTHVRQVTSSTRPSSPIEGQVIYETDTDKYQVWTGSAWAEFATQPRPATCKAHRTTDQTGVATATDTAIAFGTDAWDTDAIHDTAVNNTRFTVPSGLAGIWRFFGVLVFGAGSTGIRQARVFKNGAFTLQHIANATSAGDHWLPFYFEFNLVAGDYLELYARHTQGTNLDIQAAGEFETHAVMEFVRRAP